MKMGTNVVKNYDTQKLSNLDHELLSDVKVLAENIESKNAESEKLIFTPTLSRFVNVEKVTKVYNKFLQIEEVRREINKSTKAKKVEDGYWLKDDQSVENECGTQVAMATDELWDRTVKNRMYSHKYLSKLAYVPLLGTGYRLIAGEVEHWKMKKELKNSVAKGEKIDDRKRLSYLLGNQDGAQSFINDISHQVEKRKLTGVNIIDKVKTTKVDENEYAKLRSKHVNNVKNAISSYLADNEDYSADTKKTISDMLAVCAGQELDLTREFGDQKNAVGRMWEKARKNMHSVKKMLIGVDDNNTRCDLSTRVAWDALAMTVLWRTISATSSVGRAVLTGVAGVKIADSSLKFVGKKYNQGWLYNKVSAGSLDDKIDDEDKLTNKLSGKIDFANNQEKRKFEKNLEANLRKQRLAGALNVVENSGLDKWNQLTKEKRQVREQVISKMKTGVKKAEMTRLGVSTVFGIGLGLIMYFAHIDNETQVVDKNIQNNIDAHKLTEAGHSLTNIGKVSSLYNQHGDVDVDAVAKYCSKTGIEYNHEVQSLIENNQNIFHDHTKLYELLNHTGEKTTAFSQEEMINALKTDHGFGNIFSTDNFVVGVDHRLPHDIFQSNADIVTSQEYLQTALESHNDVIVSGTDVNFSQWVDDHKEYIYERPLLSREIAHHPRLANEILMTYKVNPQGLLGMGNPNAGHQSGLHQLFFGNGEYENRVELTDEQYRKALEEMRNHPGLGEIEDANGYEPVTDIYPSNEQSYNNGVTITDIDSNNGVTITDIPNHNPVTDNGVHISDISDQNHKVANVPKLHYTESAQKNFENYKNEKPGSYVLDNTSKSDYKEIDVNKLFGKSESREKFVKFLGENNETMNNNQPHITDKPIDQEYPPATDIESIEEPFDIQDVKK